jgi:hypothetical protein
MYLAKSESLASTEYLAYQITSAAASPQQILNIYIVNCCWYLGDLLWTLNSDFDETAAGDVLYDCSVAVSKFLVIVVEPLLVHLVAQLSSTLVKQFNDDDALYGSVGKQSLQKSDFVLRLKWVIKELFARLIAGNDLLSWSIQ